MQPEEITLNQVTSNRKHCNIYLNKKIEKYIYFKLFMGVTVDHKKFISENASQDNQQI